MSDLSRSLVSRRRLLQSAAAGALVAAAHPMLGRLPFALGATLPLGVAFDPAPFQLGVASGDPLPDSVILWTRLTADALQGGGLTDPMVVEWAVARDPGMQHLVAAGEITATSATGHAVHVDASGLEPATEYWYRFRTGATTSRVGRTKTAPAPGSHHPVRFAFCSCNSFVDGRFAAYAHLAAERIDFVAHLGDYIYEYEGAGEDGSRDHTGPKLTTLEDYRNRYALYKGDPQLRAAHAAFAWVMTWDDHEVEDNYAGSHPHPAQSYALKTTGSTPAFMAQRAAAYQAWHENTPTRLPSAPRGADMRIYRQLVFGDVLDVLVLDTRQYRDPQVSPELPAVNPAIDSRDRTILGDQQRSWLLDALDRSGAAWTCLAQQVQVAPTSLVGIDDDLARTIRDNNMPLATRVGVNADSWDGYQHDRRVLQEALVCAQRTDTVVLTGDIHSFGTHDLKLDYGDASSPTIGAEFVGGSITSGGNGDAASSQLLAAGTLAANAHTRYVEHAHRGYAVCEVTRDHWRTSYRLLVDVTDERSAIATGARFEVVRGEPGVRTRPV